MKPKHQVKHNSTQPDHRTARTEHHKLLAHATAVFGSQSLAEAWLHRPCKYLDYIIPGDTISGSEQRRAVEQYLERIELGVYQ